MIREEHRLVCVAVLFLAACNAASTPGAPASEDWNDAGPPPSDVQPSVDLLPADAAAAAAAADSGRKRDVAVDRFIAPDAFFGESRCPSGVLVCDDFEGNAVDPAKWTTTLDRGTLRIDNADHARGKGSLAASLTSTLGQSQAFINTVKTFPLATGGHLWSRFFIRLHKSLPNHWTPLFLVADTASDEWRAMTYRPRSEDVKETVAQHFWVWNNGYRASRSPPALDTWACYETEIRGTGELHFYVNGEELTDVTVKDAPALHDVRLAFGVKTTLDNPLQPRDYTIRYDAIAIGNEQIGCEN